MTLNMDSLTAALAKKYGDDPIGLCIGQTAMDVCLKITSLKMTAPNEVSDPLLKFYAEIFGMILDHESKAKEIELGRSLTGGERLPRDPTAPEAAGAAAFIDPPKTG